ncbi:acyltransferase family protein [Sphingomonas bacterium]|uniref:acyltransferase family protein n=1 Tax=Sphingomonas bacterium TaxID=1895847 RepID=UPI0020C71B62|nr:acyltransferase [Sphingomonas bacterium]
MTAVSRPHNQPHRFEALDSLRGVCACMIVLLHFKTNGVISRSALVENAFLFVDFFFVLSGFVIAASYRDRIANGFSIAKFMGLRLGRIYPLHATMLLVFLGFEIFFALAMPHGADRKPFAGEFGFDRWIAEALLLQTFTGPDRLPWNGPSWSIAVEMWTYLVFAIGFRWLGRLIVPAALVLAAGCCAFLALRDGLYLDVFHDGAFARCLYGFGLGVVAYRVQEAVARYGKPSVAAATAIEIVAIAATVEIVRLSGPIPLSLLVPPVFFLVVLVFAQQRGMVSRLLLLRPFLLAGTLSYSIYMVHAFLEYRIVNLLSLLERRLHSRVTLVARDNGVNHIGGGALFGDIMSIAMLALTIGVAALTYRFIERPGQRWSRRLILGPAPRPGTFVAEREVPSF